MNIIFLGWFQDVNKNSDKIWGCVEAGSNNYITFWGRRGKKIQTKSYTMYEWDAYEMADAKMRKGYNEVSPGEFFETYPEYQAALEKASVWALLKSN